jgi:hypothetical protein
VWIVKDAVDDIESKGAALELKAGEDSTSLCGQSEKSGA